MAEARYRITADDRSHKAVRSARQNLTRLRKSVLSARTAFTALAGASAMGFAIKKAADFGEELSNSADVAGVSTTKVQELRYAFTQLAQVTEGQVDQALQKYRRRLDLARDGTGAAVDTLEKLDINLQQKTGPALEETIAKLQRLAKEEDIAGEASQLFGEEIGPKLAAAIEKGNLDQARRLIHDIGGVLSEDAARGGAALNEEIEKLSRTFRTQLYEAILENKDELIHFVKVVRETAVNVIEWINDMSRQWRLSSLDSEIEGTRKKIEQIEEAARMQQINPALAATGHLVKAREEYGSVEEAVASLRGELEALREERRKIAEGEDGAPALDQPDVGRTTTFDQGELRRQLEWLSWKRPADATEENADRIRQAQHEIRDGQEEIRDGQREVNLAAENTGRAFESAFMRAREEGEGFRGMLQDLAEDIDRIILRENVTGPLREAITGSISSWMSEGSSGGAGVAGNVGSGNLASQSAGGGGVGSAVGGGNMRQFSEGGVSDRPAIFGEDGPEAAVPLSRGRRIPVELRGGEGGGNTYVNVRNESGGEPQVNRRRSGRDEIVDIVIPAVQAGVQDGRLDGPMRNRFGITPGTRGR